MFSMCHVVYQSVDHHFPSPRLVMESRRKCRLRQKEFAKEQVECFKKLWKEQNKRRRKRKKCAAEELAEELKVEERMIAPPSPTANARHSNEEKRKLDEVENCFLGGKNMEHASLERSEKNGEESHPSPPGNACHSDEKKRELEKADKNFPRGKKMVHASLQRSKKNGEEGTVTQKASREKVHSSTKPEESDNTIAGDQCSQLDAYRGGKVHWEWNFWYLVPR